MILSKVEVSIINLGYLVCMLFMFKRTNIHVHVRGRKVNEVNSVMPVSRAIDQVLFRFRSGCGMDEGITQKFQRVLVCAYNTEVTIQKVQDVSQKMRESLENYRQTLKRLLVWFGLEGGRTGLGCLFVKCCLLSVSFSQNCTKSTIYI